MQDVLHVYLILQSHKAATIVVTVCVMAAVLLLMGLNARRRARTREGRTEQQEKVRAIVDGAIKPARFGLVRPGATRRLPWLIVFVAFIILATTPLGDVVAEPQFKSAGTPAQAKVVKYSREVIADNKARHGHRIFVHMVLKYRAGKNGTITSRTVTGKTVAKSDKVVRIYYLPKYPHDLVIGD